MATTQHTNVTIRDALFRAGFIEGVGQNTAVFNGFSNNCLRLTPATMRGYYGKTAFWDTISTMISRRDLTSVSAATGINATQDELVSVKLFRTAGPVDYKEGIFDTLGDGETVDSFSFKLGGEVARYMVKDTVDAAILSVVTALSQETSTLVNTDTAADLDFDALNTGTSKMGDAANNIACYVMHSKEFFALVSDGLANYKIENVAGMMIATGAVQTFGRPIVVTDSASLVVTDGVTSGTDSYVTLGLVPGAVTVEESELLRVAQYFLDRDNITRRFHGEYAINVSVKGYAWDATNGGANPTDTALGTTSNWDEKVANKRDKAGVYIETA